MSSKITSLQEFRKQTREAIRKEYLDPVERIRDLEQEMVRLIDVVVESVSDLEDQLGRQQRYLNKLVKLVQGLASVGGGT